MPLTPFPYRPIGGINGEDCEDSLGETEVRDSYNFLYERKQYLNRPGVAAKVPVGFTGNFDFARSFMLESVPNTIAVSSNGKVYKLNSPTSATEITGAGTAFSNLPFCVAESVNGVVILGTNSTGVVRWDPAGSVYTVVANSNYSYLTSHLFRAVGAYKLDGSAGDTRRIGWSQSGNETLWTGGDSGTSNLVDAPDDINGLEVLRNVLVVCRRNGFHLGFATGVSQPVYNFETWGRDSAGVDYSSSLAVYDNILYYISQQDVCTFDLQQVKFIGGKIRNELFSLLRAGAFYRGFINRITSTTTLSAPRTRYNLVPMSTQRTRGIAVRLPHFVYDIQDGVWSKHEYDLEIVGGLQYISGGANGIQETPMVHTNTALYPWDATLACEQPATLTGRVIVPHANELDLICRRVLMKYRNYGVANVEVSLRARLNETLNDNVRVVQVGTSTADEQLLKRWVDINLPGGDFQLLLTVPAGHKFAGNYFSLMLAPSSEFKGDPGI